MTTIPTGNLIAGVSSAAGAKTHVAINPSTQQPLAGEFNEATTQEIEAAVSAAAAAADTYGKTTGAQRAEFLRTIASEIEELGDTLIERAMAESGLPQGRITGERGRTCGQLRKFADHIEEGSWVNAIIDEAMPDRAPFPRTDLRKVSVALGPVAVFTASNFPLAFSTAGGDSASALASGCPVIVKAHPSHLGTNALVSGAISRAVEKSGLPKGVFSSIQGGIPVGQQLVQHPNIKAIGFTGSLKGGKALFDLANQREQPIPVFAEMGSINPMFILSGKLAEDQSGLATTLAGSVNLGAGQFCTNPGLLIVEKGETYSSFIEALGTAFSAQSAQTMLNEGIHKAFQQNSTACVKHDGVQVHQTSQSNSGAWAANPHFATVDAKAFIANANLHEEVFGPFTLVVACEDEEEMHAVASSLQGQLTASLFGTDADLANAAPLATLLTERVGRLIYNMVPTGVEVCAAMHHGGPFPATTFPGTTSVGVDAIQRFVRPVTFQNAPQALLPLALRDGNPLSIWRKVNDKLTQA
ncbi:MAG: aldehyde dehydrogenase (NADP(+)) [Saprospiraceae bacterium]